MCARKMKIAKLIIREGNAANKAKSTAPKNPAPGVSKLCKSCYYWTGSNNCRAFPNGIPRDILSGKRDHRKPHSEDRGLQYRPIERPDDKEA